MEIFKEIALLKAYVRAAKRQQKSIGLVPTMGALHSGHISLAEASKKQNDITICSIFVNPTQFNNPTDLVKYPRTLDKDTLLLEKVECDAIFCPEITEMYPQQSSIKFDFGQLDKVMEGQFRPGHFSGVALIVSKLFNVVEPDHAYFGQKDWQQFAVISKLVEELKFSLTLHSVATTRETDGLAMSSRNLRLTEAQRAKAIVFYQALIRAKEALKSGADVGTMKKLVREIVEQDPEVRLEYVELADRVNLNLLERVNFADQSILCIAGFVGEIRLIDNMFLD